MGEGDVGAGVDELRRRLGRAGFVTTDDPHAEYGPETVSQIAAFQRSRGLHADGTCGLETWAALLEAHHRFGERTLYLRSPMVRGDDVAELQRCLGTLGFDAGRTDGIFGADTAKAVSDYQQNCGLTIDGVCGRDMFAELSRVASRMGETSVATVREREQLLRAPVSAAPARVTIGDFGELAGLADHLVRALAGRGADVEVVHHPDPSTQAAAANQHEAAAYLGLISTPGAECTVSYFATDDYVSYGGRHLATLLALRMSNYGLGEVESLGMRLPVLRETRMPAVVCRLGAPVSDHEVDSLVETLADATIEWLRSPVDR